MKTIISKYRNIGKALILAILPLGGVGGFTSCADWDDWTYDAEQPEDIAQYKYLDEYAPLKENVDRSQHPSFKVTGAFTASDFDSKGTTYRLAAHNFDEIVAGNAMKMASCVNDQGTMDFSTVQSFVQTAEDANLSIYGHCLAWHSQQPVKWLDKLIADKELDIDPNAKNEVVDFTQTYTDGDFPYYVMGVAPPVVDGSIHYVNTTGDWSQFFCSTANSMTAGNYVAILHINSDVEGQIQLTVQNGWGSDAQNITSTITLKTGWNDYEVKLDDIQGGSYDFILKPGTLKCTLDLNNIKVVHYESPAVEVEQEAFVQTYTDGDFPYYVMGCAPPVVDGSIHFVPTGDWSQFFCATGKSLEAATYYCYVKIKASAAESIKLTAQNGWGSDAENITTSLSLKEGWNTCKCTFNFEQGGSYDFILKPETSTATVDLNSITLNKVVKMNSIPLTDEEKKDTLTWAMNQWCTNMMAATEAKVMAWDMINEAVSGNDADKDGFYDLQHGTQTTPGTWDVGGENFFWQDYLGDENYGPIVSKAAREAYTAAGGNESDLKLFVNDYNLESDWDQNKKVKSLVHWVEIWEKNGAKIDGLGTQMHISYYENETTQESKKAAIKNMFEIMQATGKLVRISELDMGYVDAEGNSLTSAQIKALPIETRIAKEKAMADFYQWIIEQYFSIVPAAQQYGICQWCITDSPASSSWRAGQPTGLWYETLQRKPAYGGWAEGLKK